MFAAVLILAAAGPFEELAAARAAARTLPPSAVFVSFLGTAAADRPATETAFLYALNGTTFRRRPIAPAPVVGSRTLYRVDVAELAWPTEAAAALLKREPYFRPIAADVPLIRADWFIAEATAGETYYALLGFGKTLATLEARIGLNRTAAEALGAFHGARVLSSGVALNPRAIARHGSALGGAWQTFDVAAAARGNPYERIDALTFAPDASELFGPLPNGLFWFALANGKGELQTAAPAAIAADRREYKPAAELKDATRERPSYRVVEIQNSHSCLGCHALGLRSAPDAIAAAVAGDRLDVRAADPATANRIADFFDPDAQAAAIRDDSAAFVAAVKRATGAPALEAANALAVVRWRFAEKPVDAATAAAELGTDAATFAAAARAGDDVRYAAAAALLKKGEPDAARAVLGVDAAGFAAIQKGEPAALGTSTLRALAAGAALPRELWEAVHLEAAQLLAAHSSPRTPATRKNVADLLAPRQSPAPGLYRKRATDAATGRPIEFDPEAGRWEFSR